MKAIILSLFLASTMIGCGKKAVADETPAAPVKKCEAKLVASPTIWLLGTLCPAKDKAGANYKSQGAGRNPQGQIVVGCYTETVSCSGCDGECKP